MASQNPAYFRVNKNGSNQTGIVDSTLTLVTWGTEVYDNGGYFASNKWTPPAGTHVLYAVVNNLGTNTALNGGQLVDIYKNGAAIAQGVDVDYLAGGSLQTHIMVIDEANGTDYYEVYFYTDTTVATTGTIDGAVIVTFFEGWQIK